MSVKQNLLLAAGIAILALAGCSKNSSPTQSTTPPKGPVLDAIGAKNASVGHLLSFTVTATDSQSVVPVLTTSTLPTNATFTDHSNGTGSFSFTPDISQLGTIHVTFYATASGLKDSEKVAIGIDGNTGTTTYDTLSGFWTATVNATSYTTPAYYSFGKRDTVTPGGSDSLWNIAIERTEFKTNSGISADGGDVKGIALGNTNFASVTALDTVNQTWKVDGVAYFISNWYNYNINTHQLTNNRNVYTMNDATGHHYIKFRIDSLVNPGVPPNMGTVYMTYYYNPTVDSKSLTGTTSQVVIPVGSNTVYFSFASGGVVTPANPLTSTGWDLMFSNYNIGQNSGPNGPAGVAAAFYVFEYLADPTDISLVNDVYGGQAAAPLFPDAASSIFDAWYNYDTGTHILTSKNFVYLIKAAGKLYKMQIYSYYANVGGVPVSADYIFYWKQL